MDSAVRSRETQERLRRVNRAAAPVDGEDASVHETGIAVDFSKNMTRVQLQWLRDMLCYYTASNIVIAEEERRCFHVVVLGGAE